MMGFTRRSTGRLSRLCPWAIRYRSSPHQPTSYRLTCATPAPPGTRRNDRLRIPGRV
ncbi:hypothetical protein T492DRAFT_997866 [Pavlovales sp. CCMP2436]|nr:hypothetical protein T492DRAFT_997866 [Pavlovales sp. CCMP2436]